VTGLNDMRDLVGQRRRIAVVHALVNVFGLSLSAASLAYRHRGSRGLARALSGLGFALGIRVNRTVGQTVPGSFLPVLDMADLQGDELRRVDVGGVPVLLARSQPGEVCALANPCTHLGGPLAEGSRVGDTVACPWHGSRFDLRTGAVISAPAVFVQPRLEARVVDDRIEVGFPAAAGAELPELTTSRLRPARAETQRSSTLTQRRPRRPRTAKRSRPPDVTGATR
jgi:nitrite reductase/ring-hydroxylating ferredoxin subunit